MTQKVIANQLSLQDPTHDIWRVDSQVLDAFFKPNSISVIGATEKPSSVGFTLTNNLVSLFKGKVYPVNPKRSLVCGLQAYPSISAIPEKPDLAVIVTPSQTVPGLIAECAAAGVRSAIIISAGFKELGTAGAELERQVLKAAQGRVRIIGPNCLGVMNPHMQLNATFADRMAKPGNVAFLSQSGALCTAILDWSFKAHVGFSSFVSLGSMLDVNWGDLIIAGWKRRSVRCCFSTGRSYPGQKYR
jgi:acetyltransferase